ncbi:TIGR04219 family outer membrane beta-barrel protein [Salinibius halmophilus]|uniref:TIGR04219 family outer membrane beta-barrel protein n=1 Tax=Salinibius halmophilus TaxID=1853216 RepID=UPI000E670DBC|nr:TIGR04219 family outer membrane beta-barrel protein [Salinibius halmophilus]
MKKLVAAILVASAPLASAKLGLNIDVSAGGNFPTLASDSNIGDTFNLESDLGLEGQTGFYVFGSLEHPIPVLPNVRLHHKSQVLSGEKELTEQVDFLGETIPASKVQTTLDLSHTDATIFWGIPFLPVVDIEFGLNARVFNLGIEADLPKELNDQQVDDISASQMLPLPMLYLAGDATIPVVGLNLGGEFKTIFIEENNITEYNIYGRYYAPLPTNLLVKVGVEAGWRQFNMTISDSLLGQDTSDLQSDITIGGAYVGLTARF